MATVLNSLTAMKALDCQSSFCMRSRSASECGMNRLQRFHEPTGSLLLTGVAFADDLAGLLNALKIDRAVVCGLSMGGYAAFAFYRKYAGRIAALILSDTRAGADTEEGKRGRYEMADQVIQSGPSAIAGIMISKLLGPLTIQNNSRVVEKVKAVIEAGKAEAIAAAQRGMAERQDSTGLLSTISCPTLIIVGRDDALTPPNEAEKMHNQISGSRFAVISEAGHLPNLEQPEEFNRVVADFLKQI
jgi:3-oxoadipate enol-lactonase